MFELTQKEIGFVIKSTAEFTAENMAELTSVDSAEKMSKFNEKTFMFICDKMLNSEDKEIKVILSRKLMYMGFCKFNENSGDVLKRMGII